MRYRYVIVGGGIAGASAIEGIREHDREGSILLVSRENHPPYRRPPLSKDLWFGKLTLDKTGRQTLTVRAKSKPGVAVMDLRQIVLTPSK